jgi:hypothetical protein
VYRVVRESVRSFTVKKTRHHPVPNHSDRIVTTVNIDDHERTQTCHRIQPYIAEYANFDLILQFQPSQLDKNKDDCKRRYRQKTDWDGAVIVGKRFCTLALRRKRGLFDPANESLYRRNRIDIPYKGCKYGSIGILLGFSGSVFIYLWDFVR